MDVAKLVLEYVKTLAWPGFVLLLMIFFRSEFRSLLHRLKTAKGAGAEVEFAEEVREAAIASRVGAAEEAAQAAAAAPELTGELTAQTIAPSHSAEHRPAEVRPVPRRQPGAQAGSAQRMPSWDSALAMHNLQLSRSIHDDVELPWLEPLMNMARYEPRAAVLAGWQFVEVEVERAAADYWAGRPSKPPFSTRGFVNMLRIQGLTVEIVQALSTLRELDFAVRSGQMEPKRMSAREYLSVCADVVRGVRTFSARERLHADLHEGLGTPASAGSDRGSA